MLNPQGGQEESGQKNGRTHTSLGIYAVRKRLDYIYDGEAKMSITSEEGKGTEVVLKIPLKEVRRIVIDGTSGDDIR